MVVSKHLTHFCYPIRLVLHQHLNSHVAYPGILPENSASGELVLSDFDQSNLRRGYDGKYYIALVCGLNFQVGCQDRLRVNSDADEALA